MRANGGQVRMFHGVELEELNVVHVDNRSKDNGNSR
jgi:hypothetical protein